MAKDVDTLIYEKNDYKRKMHMAFDQVKVYESDISERDGTIRALLNKIGNLESDCATVRSIMAKNLTDSNVEKQQLLSEIMGLREKLRAEREKE